VFADKCERFPLDLLLGSGEDGDRAVVGKVGVEQGEQSVDVAAA
jgi:hypothetical protein